MKPPDAFIFFLIKACARREFGRSVCPSFPANICVTSPFQRPGELLDGFQGSAIMWFLFFYFLVLPVYCYPPISLHPRAHMLSCNPMDCSPPGSSVHGLLQAITLVWVAFSFSRLCVLAALGWEAFFRTSWSADYKSYPSEACPLVPKDVSTKDAPLPSSWWLHWEGICLL